MASPSTPMSRNYRFNVFPNFHGPDIRKSFLVHFLEQLKQKGLTMFDNQEIVTNEEITPALIQAIRESRIAIMVLSKNYASSRRCLDELVEILKCKGDGKMMMKIFHKVDPYDVRKLTGEFGRIFSETCAGKREEERQRWSQALKHIGNILGEDFINWEDNDRNMIEKVAEDISDKLNARECKDFDVMVILGAPTREMSSLDIEGISTSEKMDLLKRHGIDQMDFPSLGKNLMALEMELQELNAMRNELLKRVSREEDRGLQVLPEVKDWISRVQVIEPKAIRILDRSISELHKLSKNNDMCQISVWTRSYSGNVHMTLEEVKDLLKGTFKVVVDRTHILPVIEMQSLQPPLSQETLPDDITLETRCSSPEEAWDLFQEKVGETTLISNPDIPKLAKIVARKCCGFKLALYLIGVTMSSKRTAREWYHAIHLLVSSAARFSDTKCPIFPILKLLYDILPGEDIRSCFICCALCPEDGVLSKQELVHFMIGTVEEEREITEIKCYEMIGTLVRMGLLMEDESGLSVKMHDVVRGMGVWIHDMRQKELLVVKAGEEIKETFLGSDPSSQILGASASSPESDRSS